MLVRVNVAAENVCASLAQLDRATGFEPVGRGFESLRAHFLILTLIEILGEIMKTLVAKALAERVRDGDLLGLGSGTTTEATLAEIGRRIADEKIRVRGIATSQRTSQLAAEVGITVLDAATVAEVDWAFDGADEVDPEFRMIKGRGGAMLAEKIVAAKAKHLVIVVTEEKLVNSLGANFAVPVEVLPMAQLLAQRELKRLGASKLELRKSDKKYGPVITEFGNLIVDTSFSSISVTLENEINSIPGVIENGIFSNFKPELLVAKSGGVFSRKLVSGKITETLVFKA